MQFGRGRNFKFCLRDASEGCFREKWCLGECCGVRAGGSCGRRVGGYCGRMQRNGMRVVTDHQVISSRQSFACGILSPQHVSTPSKTIEFYGPWSVLSPVEAGRPRVDGKHRPIAIRSRVAANLNLQLLHKRRAGSSNFGWRLLIKGDVIKKITRDGRRNALLLISPRSRAGEVWRTRKRRKRRGLD